MKTIKALLACVFFLASGVSHATNNYQDWWWNPAQSGMGLNIGQQNDTIFVAWFNYGDDTKASFLTMGGVLNGNTLTGPLLRNTGPVPGPNYNPALVKQTAVGTATITFNSNTDATLTYSYDNKGGSMSLQRFSFANPNLNQTWTVVNTNTTTDCANPSVNGTLTKLQSIKLQQEASGKFTAIGNDLDGSNMCIAAMTLQPAGSRASAVGTMACEGSVIGNLTFDDLLIQSDYLNFSYTVTDMNKDRSFIQKGKMSGIVNKDTLQTFDYKTARQNQILKGFSKTFNVTGDCKGTFSLTESPAAKTNWNGKSVYAVGTTEIVTLPNCSLGMSDTQTRITYYDMNFVPLVQIPSKGRYIEYVVNSQPTFIKVGDTGTLGTWYNWDNISKSHLGAFDVLSYTVEPDTSTSVIFNMLDHSVLDTNQNDSNTQLRYRLTAAGDLDWISVTIDFPPTKGRLVFQ